MVGDIGQHTLFATSMLSPELGQHVLLVTSIFSIVLGSMSSL